MRLGYMLIFVFATAMLGILIKTGEPETLETGQPEFYRLFPDLTDPGQIIGMELVIPVEKVGMAIVVEQDGQTWRVRGTDILINPSQAEEVRNWLGLMPGIRQFQRGNTPSDAFGLLPEAEYVVRFQLSDLRVVSLYIGNHTPGGSAYYVASSPDSDIVDLVPAKWIDNFVMLMSSVEPISASSGEDSASRR